ncbi:MAG: helicase DnaB [Sphingomonas sp.]|nr:helicase DnaB [Sphingomonas sp.]
MTDIQREAPNNCEAEQALLGALLVNNDAFARVSAFLRPEHFHEGLHRRIFEEIGRHIAAGKSVDPVIIKPFLPANEKVGDMNVAQYLAKLAAGTVTVINANDYGQSIFDLYQRRQLIGIGEGMAAQAYDAPIETSGNQIAGEYSEKLATIQADSPKHEGPGTAKATVARMMERNKAKADMPTVAFPLEQLREVMNGHMEVGNLYGLLSGSGEGKTSLLMQIIDHAVMNGHPVLMLSYDQSPDQCINQIVSQRTGIENTRIRAMTLMDHEQERYYETLFAMSDLPLEIRKCSARDDGTVQIAGYVRRFIKTYRGRFDKHPLITLDHVRKVKPRSDRDHEGRIAGEINGVCKELAGEHGAAWLSLNQRSSAGAKRKNPRPIDSDLYGGEQAREDYDGMFYLYRPWKYWQAQLATADDERQERDVDARFTRGNWTEDQAEIGALKVRFGNPTIRRRLRFEAEYTRYVSMRAAAQPELFEGAL